MTQRNDYKFYLLIGRSFAWHPTDIWLLLKHYFSWNITIWNNYEENCDQRFKKKKKIKWSVRTSEYCIRNNIYFQEISIPHGELIFWYSWKMIGKVLEGVVYLLLELHQLFWKLKQLWWCAVRLTNSILPQGQNLKQNKSVCNYVGNVKVNEGLKVKLYMFV